MRAPFSDLNRWSDGRVACGACEIHMATWQPPDRLDYEFPAPLGRAIASW